VRESGNGGTTVIPGEPSVTHEGREDAAVHPRALGAYLRDFKKLLDRYGLKAWYYGHFGEGCIHMRINFDLESVEGVRQFRRFVQEAGNLVRQLDRLRIQAVKRHPLKLAQEIRIKTLHKTLWQISVLSDWE
jgi:hypothetical protein